MLSNFFDSKTLLYIKYNIYFRLNPNTKLKRSDIQFNEIRLFIKKFINLRQTNQFTYEQALNKSLESIQQQQNEEQQNEQQQNEKQQNEKQQNEQKQINNYYFNRDHYFPNNKRVVYEDDVFDPLIKIDRRTVQYKSSRKRACINSNYVVLGKIFVFFNWLQTQQ